MGVNLFQYKTVKEKVVLKYELEANFRGSDEGYSSRPHSIPDSHHNHELYGSWSILAGFALVNSEKVKSEKDSRDFEVPLSLCF